MNHPATGRFSRIDFYFCVDQVAFKEWTVVSGAHFALFLQPVSSAKYVSSFFLFYIYGFLSIFNNSFLSQVR